MKTFDLFIEPFLFLLELKTKKKKNGQSILSPNLPGSAGGNQTLLFCILWPFCLTSGGKFWYPEYLEIVSGEI
jgi:hypothetical protein